MKKNCFKDVVTLRFKTDIFMHLHVFLTGKLKTLSPVLAWKVRFVFLIRKALECNV